MLVSTQARISLNGRQLTRPETHWLNEGQAAAWTLLGERSRGVQLLSSGFRVCFIIHDFGNLGLL